MLVWSFPLWCFVDSRYPEELFLWWTLLGVSHLHRWLFVQSLRCNSMVMTKVWDDDSRWVLLQITWHHRWTSHSPQSASVLFNNRTSSSRLKKCVSTWMKLGNQCDVFGQLITSVRNCYTFFPPQFLQWLLTPHIRMTAVLGWPLPELRWIFALILWKTLRGESPLFFGLKL